MGYGKNPPKSGRATRKSDGSGRVPFADIRFVRIELLEQEKQQFRALLDSGEFRDLSPEYFLERDYKVTFSNDQRGGGVICSVTALQADHANAGLVLTGRGGDYVTAMAVCAFKDIYLCEGGQWREGENRRGGSYTDIS